MEIDCEKIESETKKIMEEKKEVKEEEGSKIKDGKENCRVEEKKKIEKIEKKPQKTVRKPDEDVKKIEKKNVEKKTEEEKSDKSKKNTPTSPKKSFLNVAKTGVKLKKINQNSKLNYVSICTFNTENLFARYKFQDFMLSDLEKKNKTFEEKQYFSINSKRFFFFNEKKYTAMVIREANCDIVCLQEVESLRVLERFRDKMLKKMGYKYAFLIESKDTRLISNGILSRYPIVRARLLHRNAKSCIKDGHCTFKFTREILDVDVDVNGTMLRIINAHLTSMSRGRNKTHPRRKEQAEYILKVLKESSQKNVIIVGDLNDKNDKKSAINVLTKSPLVENIIERLPDDEQWTQYCRRLNSYNQLDYVLLSKNLAMLNKKALPKIIKSGLPKRVSKYVGKRLKGIGKNYPKASDHCPVCVKIQLLEK